MDLKIKENYLNAFILVHRFFLVMITIRHRRRIKPLFGSRPTVIYYNDVDRGSQEGEKPRTKLPKSISYIFTTLIKISQNSYQSVLSLGPAFVFQSLKS